MRKYIFSTIVLCFSIHCIAQTGTIKGSVKTSDGQPAVSINVLLTGTKLGTITNATGSYEFRNIVPGNYTLQASFVGLETQTRQLTIQAGETVQLESIVLKENLQTLQEVVIRSGNPYARQPSAFVTRMDIRSLENPQSVQVIGKELIEERQMQSVAEAAKSMVGVNAFSSSQYSDYTMRGFRANAGNFAYNGLRGDFFQFDQATLIYNIDKIEAVKGPASVLFSSGNPGGTINHVTKKPQKNARYELNYTFGSFNQHRIMADATGGLTRNKQLTYRLVAGYENTGQYDKNQDIENLFIAPQLQYQFSEKTYIRYELNYLNDNRTMGFDRGTPARQNPDGSFDPLAFKPSDLSFVDPNGSAKRNSLYQQLEFGHQFTPFIKWTTLAGALKTTTNQFDITRGFRDFVVNDSLYSYSSYWNEDLYNYQVSSFVTAKFNFSKNIMNNLVFGIDANLGGRDARFAGWDERTQAVDNFAFGWGVYSKNDPNFSNIAYGSGWREKTQLLAVYVQDQISIGEKLKFLIGGRFESHRYDYVDTEFDTEEQLPDSEDKLDATQFVPRAGLVYLPNTTSSFYYSYAQGFVPQFGSFPGAGGPFAPEKSRQHEIGVKKEWMQGRLLTTLALYHIQKYDVLAPDPDDPLGLRYMTVDDVTSKGIEVSITGRVTQHLDLIANYAYNETKTVLTEGVDFNGFFQGEVPFPQAPRHVANIWGSYKFSQGRLKNLSLGAGANYISERTTFVQDFNIPGYYTIDAAVNYKINKVRLGLNAYNLTNQRYINGAYGPGALWQGNPISFRVNVGYVF